MSHAPRPTYCNAVGIKHCNETQYPCWECPLRKKPAEPWPNQCQTDGYRTKEIPNSAPQQRLIDAARFVPKIQNPPMVSEAFHPCCGYLGKPYCDCAPPFVLDNRTTAEIMHDRDTKNISPRTIIAFTGLAGSGKSTAAAHLVEHHDFLRLRFAGPLKAMLAALGCTPAEIDGDRKEQPCDLLGGKTPRWAMQSLGTEWGRDLIAPDLWIRAWNAALAKVPIGVPVVVDDCRFPNEAEAVTAAGGVVVRIDRPGAGAAAAGHSSETHALVAITTLRNTADTKFLFAHVDRLVADLSWRDANTPS